MASGKKNAKGNKTAHVLNLLTAPGGGGAPQGEEESAAPESVQPAPAARPAAPPPRARERERERERTFATIFCPWKFDHLGLLGRTCG